MNAWLIECAPPLGDTLYFCNDGDWCSNPNHAHKFPTAVEAQAKLTTMQNPLSMRIAEHEWPTSSESTPKIDAAATFLDWLKNREHWLTNEISGGGNWEHLNARRSECAYIRERFSSVLSSDSETTR